MTRLQTQYQRLYQSPDTESMGGLITPDGQVRALVLALGKPAEWADLSPVWRGVQVDLDLPAPAIAVNGVDAFELWFSLAHPVPVVQAVAFLQGLEAHYLAALKPGRLQRWPTPEARPWTAARIPARHAPDRWSAFIAPDLAAVFSGDDPSLDLQPGEEAQADLLSRIACIQPGQWQAALVQLQPGSRAAAPDGVRSDPVASTLDLATAAPLSSPAHAALVGPYEDPRLFLRDVMNDSSVPLALRLEAAKALLS